MKKILSAILAIVLVLSMVPAVVTAEAGTHSADHVCEKCGASATWTAWTSKTTLPTSGHYYLTGDVTVSNQTVASNLCLCLNGYTVHGTQNNKTFAVAATDKYIAIMDCTAATVNGVYTAGKITGGKNTTSAGGTVYVGNANNKLYFYDGIIEGNQAYAGGGGISIANGSASKGGAVFMYGGLIRNNTAKDGSGAGKAGGGVMVGNYGKFYMTGGAITGNEAKRGGGIMVGSNATVVVKNASVTNNHATELAGGVYMDAGTLSLQEEAMITGNTAVDKESPSNLFLTSAATGAVASNLKGSAKVGVTLAEPRISAGKLHVTTAAAGTDAKYFESDDADYAPKLENDQVVLSKKADAPIEPEHSHNGCNDASCTDHAAITYTKWTGKTTLPTEGSYYLTEDVTVTKQTVLTGNLDLCLNGHTITGFTGGRILASVSGFTLTLADCTAKTENGVYTAGKLTGATHSAASNNSGGAIYLGANDQLYLFDGILTGNCAYGGGGALSVGGTLYMYGGQISENTALGSGKGREGGAIYVNKTGKAYLYGGTIRDNEARVGAGIYCLGATLEITDTKILNNTATELNGGIFLADTTAVKLAGSVQVLGNTAAEKASNLVLPDKVTLSLGTVSADAKVAVTASAFRYITGETADCSDQFQSDGAALSVIHKDGKLYMDASDDHKHCLCNGATTGCDHAALKWAPWDSANSLPTSGNYYLTTDVTVSGQTGLDNTNLNLCLNGHTVKTTKGRIFYTKGNTKLSITDCVGGGKLTGADSSAIMTENVAASAPVISIYNGAFTGNTTNALGGAIVAQGSTTLHIYGGTFSENTSIGKLKVDAGGNPQLDANGNEQADNAIGGAAIGMYGANTTLNIYGGTFQNNKTTHVECKTASGGVSNKGGQGVIYIQGTANIYGGSFRGGEALLGGAFLVTGEKAVLNVENANITENQAKGGGAIVAQVGATLNLKGGTISGNECGAAGGGAVYVSNNATLNMTGGTISGNVSTGNGGGLYVSACTANLTGGSITGNTAAANGAGVYVNRATAYFNGTAVKNNTAGNNGGGIYGAGATLIQLNKGEIDRNTAKNGAGIYATINTVTSGGTGTVYYSTLEVKDGITISGNQAATNAGGILLIGEKSVMTMTGGTIKGNAGKNAGGMLVQTGATFNLAGGTITGNNASVGGGGVYLSTAKLNMTGGTVTGNFGKSNAGGMMIMRGEAVIKGGSVTGNTAENGAGIYISGAKVDIHSLSVTGNKTTKSGAGILIGTKEYTENGVKKMAVPVVNMYGGTISGNDATKGNAGGILIQSKGSVFNLKGGTITGNKAAVGGGGVYVAVNTVMNMTGGSIHANQAKQGGAIFCLRGTVNINGGKLYDNVGETSGGAVYITGNSSTPAGSKDDVSIRLGIVTVKNMDIYGNTAGTGGAFEVGNFGTLNLENCKIHDNTADNIGGGVYINKVSFATLQNVEIYDNEAKTGGGGGLAINVGSDVKAENLTVENNRADGIGGGIYNRGRLELSGSEVRANSTNGNGGGIGTFKTSSIPLSVNAGLFVKDTLITDNRSVKGAGVYMHVGCICELTDVTVEKNTAQAEGAGVFSGGQTTLNNVTITGNSSESDLYALYFDASQYDGMTYYTGKKVLKGNIILKDNQGGEAYLGQGAAIAIPGEGIGADTYLPITLHSGLLTKQVVGIYHYEGGDLEYVITAGDRSVTDPEIGPAEENETKTQEQTRQESGNTLLYLAVGAVALLIVAAVVLVLLKKKKSPAGESK